MPANNVPILLTSSVVAHDQTVALTDTNERIRLTLESIDQWLKTITPAPRIVLCDGSSFDFSSIVAQRFPQAQIECLFFENDQALVNQYGRGYGEGEIVRYALSHSKFIMETGCFAKCSSKLWVKNFAQCLSAWNGQLLCKAVFLNVFSPFKKTEFSYIDTRFYISSRTIYMRYFKDAHFQINKNIGHGLEECFRDVFVKNKLAHALFKNPPVICGVGGGTGSSYKNSLKRTLKEKLRMKLVSTDSQFTQLFSNGSLKSGSPH